MNTLESFYQILIIFLMFTTSVFSQTINQDKELVEYDRTWKDDSVYVLRILSSFDLNISKLKPVKFSSDEMYYLKLQQEHTFYTYTLFYNKKDNEITFDWHSTFNDKRPVGKFVFINGIHHSNGNRQLNVIIF